MYTLYHLQGSCSIATKVVLRELDQDVNLIDVMKFENFKEINPIGAVPVLIDGENTLTEGGAIILYLLDKHSSPMLPSDGIARQKAIQDIMFANATMHPAYGRLFFLEANISDEASKNMALHSAAKIINDLWKVVESELVTKPFLGGNSPSAADIMLTVFSVWGDKYPVDIIFGEKTMAMLDAVKKMPSFYKTIEAEQAESAKLVNE
jgi:glutathione S-transferase